MGNFDELPDPETIQRVAAARESDASRLARFVRESEPLFFEMATKLPDHVPSASFNVKKKERYGLFGTRERERTTSVRGWPLGDCNPGNELYRTTAYLLSDGSVYPSIEAGMVALLGRSLQTYLDTDDIAGARRLLIEGLKKRYTEWCSEIRPERMRTPIQKRTH